MEPVVNGREPPAGHAPPAAAGLNWFRFWTYVYLPVVAASGMLGFFALMHGQVRQGLIVGLAGFFFLRGVMALALAWGLHHRRLWAWRLNWLEIGSWYLSAIRFVDADRPSDMLADLGIGIVLISLVWMYPNYIYWKKRRGLFQASEPMDMGKDSTRHSDSGPRRVHPDSETMMTAFAYAARTHTSEREVIAKIQSRGLDGEEIDGEWFDFPRG